MKKLKIKCKSCGDWFDSPVQMNEESFESAKLANNSLQCGYCHSVNSYSKDHMKFM